MLAYIFWHRPDSREDRSGYDQALLGFHRSLAHNPPSGFRGSHAFAPTGVPWATHDRGAAYEDWYLLDSFSALGVLEEAAVAHGHASLHDAIARRSGWGTGSLYRLLDGHCELAEARSCLWVMPPSGHHPAALADLLADGIDGSRDSLWRRSLALGPAPEYVLMSAHGADDIPSKGLSRSRLPDGWRVLTFPKEDLLHG